MGILKLGQLLELFKLGGGLIIDRGRLLPAFKQAVDFLPDLRFAFGQGLSSPRCASDRASSALRR